MYLELVNQTRVKGVMGEGSTYDFRYRQIE
jgi:hypothetical protein